MKLKSWSDNIDPATIPDAVILSERARRNSAKRATRSGGHNGGRPKGSKNKQADAEFAKAFLPNKHGEYA